MIQEILCITFVSSVPFIFSLQGDFVFDDSEAIVKNKDVTSDSWSDPFNNDFWGTNIKSNLSHKSYRPLTILSFRLNYFLSYRNLVATQFKLCNLICHVACCLLVWRAYDIIWKRVRMKDVQGMLDVPVLATLMFGVHPVHVEAISGIVGRADLLSTFTFLLSFLVYERAIKSDSYINIHLLLSILLAGTSMFFKENGITILGVCLIYDLLCNFNKTSNTKKLHKRIGFKNIYFNTKCVYRILVVGTAAILLLYTRWEIMGRTQPEFKPIDNPTAFSDSLITKIATYNYIYFLNFTLLVWPHWLCYDWSMGCVPLIKNVLDFRILLPILLYSYAVLFIKIIISNRNRKSYTRALVMTVVFMVLPFLPASNIVYPVGFVIAERILYIPSIGYCLLIAIGVNKIAMKIKRRVVIGFFYIMLLIFSMKSWQRSLEWRNEYDLFTNAWNVCPLNAKVHYNIAKVADARRNTSWALAEYKEAIRLYPEYYQAMNNLANLLKNQNQYNDAEFYLKKAIYHKNDFPAAWMNLGIVLANTKRFEESENAYQTALRYRKKYPDCYYNMGNLYLEMKRSKDAIENWFQAINLNPKHASAWTNLLALLDNTGQTDKALQIIPKALIDLPETPSINFAIANIYGRTDKYAEAEKYFRKAIWLFGDRVQAIHYANLGVLYHRWKKYKLARAMYEMALKIDPTFPSAKKNLNNLSKLKI